MASLFDINNKSFITDIPVNDFNVPDFDSVVLTHLCSNGYEINSELPKSIILGCAREKIQTRSSTKENAVSYKDEMAIKLHKFISINDKKYELSGIARHISHESKTSEGHYIAYCKSFNEEFFYEFNDAVVNKMTFEEVIKKNCTECKIIIYTQKDNACTSSTTQEPLAQSQEGNLI